LTKYHLKYEIIELDLDTIDPLDEKKRKLETSSKQANQDSSSIINLFQNQDAFKTTNEILLIQIHK